MTVSSYRDLRVWQKAMDLVASSYEVAKQFPQSELYGLVSQIQRAAVSIPANIAEGTVVNTSATIFTICRWPTAR